MSKFYLIRTATILLMVCMTVMAYAQKKPVEKVNSIITQQEAEAHLHFLAADEMRGRNTGSPELDIAANYIAMQFKQYGIKPAPGAPGYFQPVFFQKTFPPSSMQLKLNEETFRLKDHLLLFDGGNVNYQGDVVFAGYATPEDLTKSNVKGKVVVALVGLPNENNLNKAFLQDAAQKNTWVKEAGGAALIEIVTTPGVPFEALAQFLHKESIKLKRGAGVPHLWMRNMDTPALTALKETKQTNGMLTVAGARSESVAGKNVAALIEGTDAKLKNEYIVVSAHYDHVGVGRKNAEQDSIFNGARDNAIGVVGLLATAKYLSMYPPKRSVLLLALTAEEQGLLGSAWYAENPLVPLKQTVFNFNCDGAGYNDKTVATVIGLERTTAENDIKKACEAFGLKAMVDPVPEQNLYERSDNYNFAVKGVPAIDFAPGVKAFDQELMKYYHQQADEVSSLDFEYLIRYFRAYVYANVLIANNPVTPFWKAGDKFEQAGNMLYGR